MSHVTTSPFLVQMTSFDGEEKKTHTFLKAEALRS